MSSVNPIAWTWSWLAAVESRGLSTDTPTHDTIRTPLTFRGQAPLSKLEIRPPKKNSQQFPHYFLHFLISSCLYSQVPRLLRKLFLAWKLGVRWASTVVPFVLSGEAGATKEEPHPAPKYWGCRALLPSLRCPLLTGSTLVINAQGPTPFESNYSPYGSLSTK